jgi:hypothetical protein
LTADNTRFGTEDFKNFTSALGNPGEVRELRIIQGKKIIAGYFDDIGKIAKTITSYNGRAAIYITLNPTKPALLARAENKVKELKTTTSDKDIQRRLWILIDLDPERPADISSTDGEKAIAKARLDEIVNYLNLQGITTDSYLLGDSGNGYHILLRIDLPNDKASTELCERFLQSLDLKFSDDSVKVDQKNFNAARISKVFGTQAVKGDSTKDRPHRLARLLHRPTGIKPVARDIIELIAAGAPRQPQAINSAISQPIEIEKWLAKYDILIHRIKDFQGGKLYTIDCQFDQAHGRDAYVIQYPNGAIAAGCFHNGCTGNDWHALREKFEPKAARIKQTYIQPKVEPKDNQNNGHKKGYDWKAEMQSYVDLMKKDIPPIKFIIDQMLARPGLGVLGGKKKSGKSYLVLDLAISVAQGQVFLGFRTIKARVVYFALEDGERRIKQRLLQKRAPFSLDIVFFYKWPALNIDLGRNQFIEMIETLKPGAIIIDTLASSKNKLIDENDNNAMADFINWIHSIAIKYDLTILIVAHHGKKSTGEPGFDIRGASATPGATDVNMGLYKKEGCSELKIEGRDIPDLELTIQWEDYVWKIKGNSSELRRIGAEDKILEAIMTLGNAAETAAIAKVAQISRSTAQFHLERMRKEGTVDFEITLIKNTPHIKYKLLNMPNTQIPH